MIICSVQYGRVTSVYARVRIIIIFMYSIYMFIVCKLRSLQNVYWSTLWNKNIYYILSICVPITYSWWNICRKLRKRKTNLYCKNVGGVITYKNRAILVRQTAYFQNFFSSKMHVLTQGLNIFNFYSAFWVFFNDDKKIL